MNNEKAVFNFTNEDGTVVSKEDFLKMAEETYEEITKRAETTDECDCGEYYEESAEDIFTSPEMIVDVNEVLANFDLRTRSIYITEEINNMTANAVLAQIKFWNATDEMDGIPKEERIPIKVYIDTPGGYLESTMSIVDSIQLSVTPVVTVVTGMAYSGGFFIAIAGHKRFIYPNASLMFHEGSFTTGGDSQKLIQSAEFYKYQLSRLKKHTLNKTKITEDEYNKHRYDDWYFGAEDAIKFGISDEILEEIL